MSFDTVTPETRVPEGNVFIGFWIESFTDIVDLKTGLWVRFLELKSMAHKATLVSRTAILREMAGVVRWYRFVLGADLTFWHDESEQHEIQNATAILRGRSR